MFYQKEKSKKIYVTKFYTHLYNLQTSLILFPDVFIQLYLYNIEI